eukprot:jgi/Phyca11/100154/e_gw1.4.1081.1
MHKYHKAEMEEFENRERQAKQLRLARTLAPSLDKAADKIHKISADQQQRVNTLLAQWIAAHFRPLVLVEDEDLEKDAMASMREKVQSFRSLSVYFRRSAKGHNCLADIQKKNGGTKAVNMIVDCPTRWNSCYDMLQ